MNSTQLQKLISRRDELVSLAESLAATPASERPSKPTKLKAWERELSQIQMLSQQLTDLIERATAERRPAVPQIGPEPILLDEAETDAEAGLTVAKVRKGRRAEIRVTVKPWKGRRVIDVRLWSKFQGQGDEMKPSRKGIAFDAGKLAEVIDALIQAKQYL